jgi:hypothetical protein
VLASIRRLDDQNPNAVPATFVHEELDQGRGRPVLKLAPNQWAVREVGQRTKDSNAPREQLSATCDCCIDSEHDSVGFHARQSLEMSPSRGLREFTA